MFFQLVSMFADFKQLNARRLLCPALADRRFMLSTVFWGANDSVSSAKNVLQHVPIEGALCHPRPGASSALRDLLLDCLAEYGQNLRTTYHAALAVSRYVVAITPPPVDSARWPDRSPEQVRWRMAREEGPTAPEQVRLRGVTRSGPFEHQSGGFA